jgi:hypothetical protein
MDTPASDMNSARLEAYPLLMKFADSCCIGGSHHEAAMKHEAKRDQQAKEKIFLLHEIIKIGVRRPFIISVLLFLKKT